MFDTSNPRNIWVAPNLDDSAEKDKLGTFDNPFLDISAAIKKVSMGQRIILLPGIYEGDLTVDISGDMHHPIRITAYKLWESIIENGCWYFYDASDLIVSGFTFKNARRGAMSVIGQCARNRFHSINFINCGADEAASCALYFGGTGTRINTVDNCVFSRKGDAGKQLSAKTAAVGIMVSGGSSDDTLARHIIARNILRGYDKAIVLGSEDSPDYDGFYSIESNIIEDCGFDGISTVCGDTVISDNIIRRCAYSGINMSKGIYSTIQNNTIENCGCGIFIRGGGPNVIQNRIAECKSSAVLVENEPPVINLFIDKNDVIDCGEADTGAIIIDKDATGIIQDNRFYGQTPICFFKNVNKDNAALTIGENTTLLYIPEGMGVYSDGDVVGDFEYYVDDDGEDVYGIKEQTPDINETTDDSGYVVIDGEGERLCESENLHDDNDIYGNIDDAGSADKDDDVTMDDMLNFMFNLKENG